MDDFWIVRHLLARLAADGCHTQPEPSVSWLKSGQVDGGMHKSGLDVLVF